MARPSRSPERSGPRDADDVDPDASDAPGIVDFGAVRVPVPERGTITVEPGESDRMQAVHISLPEGRLSVSALAAPKSSRLWPDLAKEIDASLREGGARVRSFQGEWGRELHATSGAATSVFVGVDGARWMLYGVATGPTRDAAPLLEELRLMVRGTIVVRGRSPYPVRTVLPLEPPGHLVDEDPNATVAPTPTVVVRTAAPAALSAAPAVPDGDGAIRSAGGGQAADRLRSEPVVAPVTGVRGSLPVDAASDPEDRPTDVWPDGVLPGSRGGGGGPRPVTTYGGGRRRAPEPPPRVGGDPFPAGPRRRVPDADAFRATPSHPAGVAPPGGPRPTSVPTSGATSVPEVPRRGRHAAAESWDGDAPSLRPGGRSGAPSPRTGPGNPALGLRRASLQWSAAGPGPVGVHGPRDGDDPITEPLPLVSPPARPAGRHRRRD